MTQKVKEHIQFHSLLTKTHLCILFLLVLNIYSIPKKPKYTDVFLSVRSIKQNQKQVYQTQHIRIQSDDSITCEIL